MQESQEGGSVHLPFSGLSRPVLEPVARTTVAATASFAIAEAVGLPEAQWAAISTIVVLQSLSDALTVSGQRFIGTILGAAAGALLAGRLGPAWFAFAAGLLGLGLLCAALRLDRAAYRFAAITVAIVVLQPRSEPAWIAALHRCIEVSVGIAVGLIVSRLWPVRESGDSPPVIMKSL
jgi:uncharacterized membrane protein YgaE (UPF0421/DUF939 family)